MTLHFEWFGFDDAARMALAHGLRKEVFVDEQGFSLEADRDEQDKNALHVLGLDETGAARCTARVFADAPGVWHAGRIAVQRGLRGQGVGRLLLAAVAGISLLVGGIGIMNIMYVSVTERTREIGLRMSIGAKGRDILAQFLIESILISVTGGVIGILVGVGAAVLVNIFAAFPIYIQPWSVFLSFAVCTLTGIFFGWYPAQKAAMLNPIDALRYE